MRVKGGSGWFATGSYKLSPAQPTDAEARDTDLWRAWCERLGKAQHEEPLPDSWADEGWLPMWTAPTRSKNVRVRTSDGTVHQPVYFAQDLSGEEQPPFSGWFEPQGKSYAGVVDVKAWMPLAATSAP